MLKFILINIFVFVYSTGRPFSFYSRRVYWWRVNCNRWRCRRKCQLRWRVKINLVNIIVIFTTYRNNKSYTRSIFHKLRCEMLLTKSKLWYLAIWNIECYTKLVKKLCKAGMFYIVLWLKWNKTIYCVLFNLVETGLQSWKRIMENGLHNIWVYFN